MSVVISSWLNRFLKVMLEYKLLRIECNNFQKMCCPYYIFVFEFKTVQHVLCLHNQPWPASLRNTCAIVIKCFTPPCTFWIFIPVLDSKRQLSSSSQSPVFFVAISQIIKQQSALCVLHLKKMKCCWVLNWIKYYTVPKRESNAEHLQSR